jgi:hypothetical protein
MIKWNFSNKGWLDYVKMKDLSIGISMADIFTVSSIKIERGIEYPFQRSVAINLSARF